MFLKSANGKSATNVKILSRIQSSVSRRSESQLFCYQCVIMFRFYNSQTVIAIPVKVVSTVYDSESGSFFTDDQKLEIRQYNGNYSNWSHIKDVASKQLQTKLFLKKSPQFTNEVVRILFGHSEPRVISGCKKTTILKSSRNEMSKPEGTVTFEVWRDFESSCECQMNPVDLAQFQKRVTARCMMDDLTRFSGTKIYSRIFRSNRRDDSESGVCNIPFTFFQLALITTASSEL